MPRIRTGAIQVDGIRELDAALKGMDTDLRRELRAANKEAAEMVTAHAQQNAQGLGSTAAHVAPSIRMSAGYLSAGVSIGGPGYEMAAGAEFGGGRRPTTMQFQPWRGAGPGAGYFVYPAIRADSSEIEHKYTDRVDALLRRAFPE